MREWKQQYTRWSVCGAGALAAAGAGAIAIGVLNESPDRAANSTVRVMSEPEPRRGELDCDDVVADGPRIDRFDRRWDVIVGSLAFVGLVQAADEPQTAFRRRRGTDAVWKAPLALKPGAHATIDVLTPSAEHVSMTYLRPSHQVTQIADGARSVRLSACPGPDRRLSAWPGGFLMRRAQCVRLRVTLNDQASRIVDVGFGTTACPRRR
jgi:hypothetical protein